MVDLGQEIANIYAQLRGLNDRVGNNEVNINNLGTSVARDVVGSTSTNPTNGILNFIRNSDATISATTYISATYSGSSDDAAHIYNRASSTLTALTQSVAATRSGDALGIDTGSLNTFWKKNEGQIAWGGAFSLYFPLKTPVGTRSTLILVKIIVRLKDGASSITGKKIKASLWDNAIPGVASGTPFKLTTTLVGSTGSVTRDYILKVTTNTGEVFYSYVNPSTGNGGHITNATDPASFSDVNYVTVQWANIPEAIRYQLYRADSVDGTGHYYQILDSATATIFNDKGGRPTVSVLTSAPTQVNPEASSIYTAFGAILDTNIGIFKEINFTFRVPSNYTMSTDQWLKLDVLNSDDTLATLSAGVILIDKVGLSYTSGQWQPSPDDSGFLPSSLTPDATGTGTYDPPARCHQIDAWIHVPAGRKRFIDLQEGDEVISPDPQTGEITVSHVVRTIIGLSQTMRVFTTEAYTLRTSHSQPMIKNLTIPPIVASFLHEGDNLLIYDMRGLHSYRTHVEDWMSQELVGILVLDQGCHTYIANNHVIHNVKPIGIGEVGGTF